MFEIRLHLDFTPNFIVKLHTGNFTIVVGHSTDRLPTNWPSCPSANFFRVLTWFKTFPIYIPKLRANRRTILVHKDYPFVRGLGTWSSIRRDTGPHTCRPVLRQWVQRLGKGSLATNSKYLPTPVTYGPSIIPVAVDWLPLVSLPLAVLASDMGPSSKTLGLSLRMFSWTFHTLTWYYSSLEPVT